MHLAGQYDKVSILRAFRKFSLEHYTLLRLRWTAAPLGPGIDTLGSMILLDLVAIALDPGQAACVWQLGAPFL